MRSVPAKVGLCVTVLGLLSTATLSAAEHEGRVASLEEAFADKVKAVEESLARTIDRLEERFSDVLAEIEKLEDRKENLVDEADEIMQMLDILRDRLNDFGGVGGAWRFIEADGEGDYNAIGTTGCAW